MPNREKQPESQPEPPPIVERVIVAQPESNLASVAHWGIGEWAAYGTLAIAIVGIIIRNEQRMTRIEITQDMTSKILDKLSETNSIAAANTEKLIDVKQRVELIERATRSIPEK